MKMRGPRWVVVQFKKICIRASLHKLLKNSASNRFWEGHDFSRAAKPFKIGCALAPEVGFLLPKRVLPQPIQRCHIGKYERLQPLGVRPRGQWLKPVIFSCFGTPEGVP
jgi:hypothetical protein